MKKLIAIFFITLTYSLAYAEELHRPKIGLVLSGGGARGSAHIGVIESLEEMNIPIDLIVGTSMGAVIGGLYAAGVPIETIKRDFINLNWNEIFSYNINRCDLYYRRKLDSDLFVIKNFISYSHGRIHIPMGIITGQSLYEVFTSYLLPIEPIKSFNQLPIPFKAVSTDLVTGKVVVLDQGDLGLSLLASMAVPGIISPIDMNGYLLVDGGVSSNLPVEVAKNMGAEILIVVDVSTPLYTKAQIIDLTGVLGQLTNILTHRNLEISKSLLTNRDILLEPDVQKIDTTAFDKFSLGIQAGKKETFQHESKLLPLASASNIKPHIYPQTNLVEFDEIYIKNEETVCFNTYAHYLDFDNGCITQEEVKSHIDKLYGLDIFERIYYGIEEGYNKKILVVEPIIKGDNPVYLQGSLLLDTDFQTINTFGIVLGITNPRVNSLLGEWRLLFKVGQGETVLAEYYQPVSTDLAWYFNTVASIQRTPFYLYYDFDPIGLYLNTSDIVAVSIGRNFSNYGRILGFWQYEYDVFKLQTGFGDLPEGHLKDGSVGLALEWDTVDNIYFPHHGLKGTVRYAYHSDAFGSDGEFSQLDFSNIIAGSLGKHAIVLGGKYQRTLSGNAEFDAKYFLGGLFELSGLSNNELFGNNAALLSAIYFYNWLDLHVIPNRPSPIYLGGSLEIGKVWGNANLSSNRAIESASLFVGIDSLIGPIYFAVASTTTGNKSVQLLLRPAFK